MLYIEKKNFNIMSSKLNKNYRTLRTNFRIDRMDSFLRIILSPWPNRTQPNSCNRTVSMVQSRRYTMEHTLDKYGLSSQNIPQRDTHMSLCQNFQWIHLDSRNSKYCSKGSFHIFLRICIECSDLSSKHNFDIMPGIFHTCEKYHSRNVLQGI